MATVIVKSKRICDMCGDEKTKFINGNGYKVNINRGWVQSQSDRWEKVISLDIKASIPYYPSDDICTDCVRESLAQAIKMIDEL